MGEDDVNKFLAESKNDDKVFVVVEEDKEKFFGEPPTKLKNPRFFAVRDVHPDVRASGK